MERFSFFNVKGFFSLFKAASKWSFYLNYSGGNQPYGPHVISVYRSIRTSAIPESSRTCFRSNAFFEEPHTIVSRENLSRETCSTYACKYCYSGFMKESYRVEFFVKHVVYSSEIKAIEI